MIKKNIILLSLLFFFNSCGFTPIYLTKTNVNFSIEQANYTGDRELNNFLKVNLNKYKNEKLDNKVLIENNIKFIVQFNGKTRKIIVSKKDTSEDVLLSKIKEDNKLNEYLGGKEIKRKIFIPNKLINIITI